MINYFMRIYKTRESAPGSPTSLMMKKLSKISVAVVLGASLAGSAAFAAVEVAKVNGQSITDQDMRAALSNLNDGQRQEVLKDPNSKRQILGGLIDQEVLVDEASKEKLDQDAAYKDAVAAFRKQFLATRIMEKNISTKLTETAAKKYYDLHRDRYSTDQVHVMHILVNDEETAREVAKLVKAEGADFQAIAEKYSKDPSVKNNRGDIGFIGRDRFVPEFTEAAFEAKEGDIVGPIKTSYGYHVIEVVKKRPGKALEYGEVELKVKSDLRQVLAENYVANLRKTAKVKIDEQNLEKVN
jgi:parvulin-like peptidyl-prolyl isomerase